MDIQILECRRFATKHPLSAKSRTVKDYEIDIELGEERFVVIDGEAIPICRGCVCVRKPGQTIYGIGTQNSILLTVDFSSQQSPVRYSRNIEGPLQPLFSGELLENLQGVIVPHAEHTFIPIYTELLEVAFTDAEAAKILVLELLYKLNAEVCRNQYQGLKPAKTACSLALGYLKNNLEKEITLEQLAEHVHLNKNYLVRLFKQAYGKSPIRMLISLRMELARDLLTSTDMPVGDIAAACGYTSAAYFTAEYKKQFGLTPKAQRAAQREKSFPVSPKRA